MLRLRHRAGWHPALYPLCVPRPAWAPICRLNQMAALSGNARAAKVQPVDPKAESARDPHRDLDIGHLAREPLR